ncbi:MAG TPA: riboflavin kinase [Candidatus Paceibacterota bacterium]
MDFKITGKVVKGDGYGKKLGFPTVNLEVFSTEELPPEGVYVGVGILEGGEYRAGIVIGPKKDNKNKVEAHLIGYNGDAYGKEVRLKINKFLRKYQKFDTEAELIIQIKKDIDLC